MPRNWIVVAFVMRMARADPTTPEMIDQMRARTGLFAWSETRQAIDEWHEACLYGAAGSTLRTAPVTTVAADPERAFGKPHQNLRD